MKIGIFHTTLPSAGRKVGGVEVFVHRLASSLVNAKCDVEVISLTDPPLGAIYKHRQLFRRFPSLGNKQALRLGVLPVLLNFAGFGRYDIVHLHGDDWFYVARNVPTVRTFYGSALFESRSARTLKRKIAQRMVYPLEHCAGVLADVVLACGTEASRIYKADGVAKLFVSGSQFYPGEKTPEPSFVFVGLWEGRKRGKFVAERFAKEILPNLPEAKLYMACDFVPDVEGIINLNHPSDAALSKTIREAWALLSASTYEGFGLPYLEAICSGTVVITTRNSGAEYVLEDGKYGLIVPDERYSETVLKVARDSALRKNYESLALGRAADFSESQVIAEHIAFYHAAIERKRRTREA